MDKKVALWGAGQRCCDYLRQDIDIEPICIFDNDEKKDGTNIEGIPVVYSGKVENWSDYFIIIISQYENEIKMQLEKYGLIYKRDYISIYELHMQSVSVELISDALKESFFGCNEEAYEMEIRVKDMKEYQALLGKCYEALKYENIMGNLYYRMIGKTGVYRGYCSSCEAERGFIVDYFWSKGKMPAWRETVTCPVCNCNSRMRFVIDYVKKNYKDKKIFMYEKVTCTYKALERYVSDIQGSEYLSDELKSGDIINGILHEDAMNLSFDDESFDVMVSNDVFEHVSNYALALKEAYRCLKKGGKLIVSIPIFKDRNVTVQRAWQDSDNHIQHLLPPDYHGNPLSESGSLVFSEFGWDFIESLYAAGFSKAYGIVYYSAKKGYFGDMPVCFEAVK